jgi:hypothetical protein
VKVCSTTFLSLSWPKLLCGKYWFNRFSGWFSWYSNTGSAGFQAGSAGFQILAQPVTQPVFSLVETGSASFKIGSAGFCTVHFFYQSAVSAKKLCAAF